MKLLSMIIPAYNSEAFLADCIESMLEASVLKQLEIIVVNDGSTDSTGDIAREYCRRYPDTVRLLQQENRGHGGALNTGIGAASGRYFKVVDSDDTLETANLPEFVSRLEALDADVILSPHRTYDISTGKWKDYPLESRFMAPVQPLSAVLDSWQAFAAAMSIRGITYRTDFYRQYAQPLPEHVFYEDFTYATYPCCHVSSVAVVPVFLYRYRIGDKHQSVADANQLRQIHHIEQVLMDMLRRYDSLTEDTSRRYAARKCHQLILSYLTTALLVCPDRPRGRKMAGTLMEQVRTRSGEIWRMTLRKYRIFRLMNRLGISKAAWEALQETGLYTRLRKRI